jgi:hypothetical protein
MLARMPTVVNTLRLFFGVLRHVGLRQKIADAPDLVDFLLVLVEDAEPAILALIVTVLRRIPLSGSLVAALGAAGFLA